MNALSQLVVQLENARDEGDLHTAQDLQFQIDMLNKKAVLLQPLNFFKAEPVAGMPDLIPSLFRDIFTASVDIEYVNEILAPHGFIINEVMFKAMQFLGDEMYRMDYERGAIFDGETESIEF